jgi:hypothetical protein
MLVAMAKVVRQMITMVLERVVVLILCLSARPAAAASLSCLSAPSCGVMNSGCKLMT